MAAFSSNRSSARTSTSAAPKRCSSSSSAASRKRTPGSFRTRIVTEGVTPTLNVHYKNARIKQYHKEQRALRTETTINNARDFGIGKRLHNLPKLREIGFAANRRLLEAERLSHDCILAEDSFRKINGPVEQNGQRASGLRFADPRIQFLWQAVILFRLQANGFRAADLRQHLAALSGRNPSDISQGALTYQLRRLRLHGIIEKVANSFRYRITASGFRAALFFTRAYNRLLRPGLAAPRPSLRRDCCPIQKHHCYPNASGCKIIYLTGVKAYRLHARLQAC